MTLLCSLPYVFRLISSSLLSRLLLLFAFTRLAVFLCTLVSSPLLCWLHRNGKVCANLHRCPLITFLLSTSTYSPALSLFTPPFTPPSSSPCSVLSCVFISPLVSVSALILCNYCHYLSGIHLFLQGYLIVAVCIYGTLLCIKLITNPRCGAYIPALIDKLHTWTLITKNTSQDLELCRAEFTFYSPVHGNYGLGKVRERTWLWHIYYSEVRVRFRQLK